MTEKPESKQTPKQEGIVEILKSIKWDMENRSSLLCDHCERRFDDDICDKCFKKRIYEKLDKAIKISSTPRAVECAEGDLLGEALDALASLNDCRDEEGNFVDKAQDQLSVASEKMESVLHKAGR